MPNEKVFTKDAFLSARDVRVRKVEIPELKERPDDPMPVMYVKVMTGLELESYIKATRPNGEFVYNHSLAQLLVRTICDEQGKRLFGDEEFASLSEKSAPVLENLAHEARDLNGLLAKNVEDKAKN